MISIYIYIYQWCQPSITLEYPKFEWIISFSFTRLYQAATGHLPVSQVVTSKAISRRTWKKCCWVRTGFAKCFHHPLSSHLAHWASHKRRCFAHPLQHESLGPSKAQNPKKSCQLQVGHEDSIARVGKNWKFVGIPSHPTIRSLWSKTLDSCCIRSSSKKSAGFGEPGAVFKLAFSRVKWLSTGWNPEMMLVDVGWCFFLISLPSITILAIVAITITIWVSCSDPAAIPWGH